MGSQSATAISRHFGQRKVFPNRQFAARTSDTLVNWGHTSPIPVFAGKVVLNKPEKVAISSSKIEALTILANVGVRTIEWDTQRSAAQQWIDDGKKVFCRTLTRASQGRGIVVAETAEELVSAPLYTKRMDHTNEYRVHLFKGRVIDIVEKRRMNTATLAERNIEVDNDIKSHDRGWVFVHGSARLQHIDGAYKNDVANQAYNAIMALNLDFGAVDVLYNNPERKAYVVEVNSAPGMEAGTTTHYNWTNALSVDAGGTALTPEQYEAMYPDAEVLGNFENINNYKSQLTNGVQ